MESKTKGRKIQVLVLKSLNKSTVIVATCIAIVQEFIKKEVLMLQNRTEEKYLHIMDHSNKEQNCSWEHRDIIVMQ